MLTDALKRALDQRLPNATSPSGQTTLARSGSTSQGGKTGARNNNRSRPRGPRIWFNVFGWPLRGFGLLCGHGSRLAWLRFALSAAFRGACVFSLAANSCLTLVVIVACLALTQPFQSSSRRLDNLELASDIGIVTCPFWQLSPTLFAYPSVNVTRSRCRLCAS